AQRHLLERPRHDPRAALADQLVRPRLAEAPEEDCEASREMIAAQRDVQRATAAALGVAVHEIVVDEEIGVQQLDADRRVERRFAVAAAGLVPEQHQRASKTLSTA